MRNFVFVFFLPFILTSCSSNKIINDYLKQESKNSKVKKIIIAEKINSNEAIDLLFDVGELKNKKQLLVQNNSNLDLSAFFYLKHKYESEHKIKKWNKNDIRSDFYCSENELNKVYRENSNFGVDTLFAYSFSKPIFFKESKRVFFKVYKGQNLGQKFVFAKVIIMEKVNQSWVIVEEKNQSGIFN